jgi:hypothetical protein
MSIIEFIRDRARYYNCPVCRRSLKDCTVRMLHHVEDKFTVQVTCAACQVTFIVVLAIQGPGVEPAEAGIEVDEELAAELQEELGLDVDAQAAEPVAVAEPIDGDEVLDVHLYLRDFGGSLTDLVKQPDPAS